MRQASAQASMILVLPSTSPTPGCTTTDFPRTDLAQPQNRPRQHVHPGHLPCTPFLHAKIQGLSGLMCACGMHGTRGGTVVGTRSSTRLRTVQLAAWVVPHPALFLTQLIAASVRTGTCRRHACVLPISPLWCGGAPGSHTPATCAWPEWLSAPRSSPGAPSYTQKVRCGAPPYK